MRRPLEDRMLGGVCGCVSHRMHIDVTIVRVVFILMALGGFGIALYFLGWLFIPLEGEDTSIATRSLSDPSGIAIAVALVPVLVLVVLASRAVGLSFFNSFSWALVIGAGGFVLVSRNASDAEKAQLRRATGPLAGILGRERPTRRLFLMRIAFGLAILLGGLAALISHPTHAAFRSVGGLLLVMGAIVIVFGPWWLRLAREVVSERQARARAEERADLAAKVHDSVLQTLALIQRQSDHPDQVVKLARAQERELRTWLFDGRAPAATAEDDATLAEGVARIQQSVESAHGANVEAVVVGDCPLDDRVRGLLDAGREAVVNATKWSGAPVVSVYAEVEPTGVSLFVRDRGSGFDPDAVPEDRKGVAESIRGRMRRLGGTATIRSTPGEGTEVALHLPLDKRERRSSTLAS
jgi:signal transduction histidine kinase